METRELIEPLHYEGWSDERIREQHISIYGSHYAAHAATCGPCVRDIAEQERRWTALDASVPCSHSIPGTCDYC